MAGNITKDISNAELVSVIIPAFNDTAGLRLCLDGIAGQRYPMERIEVVVVDNGSRPAIVLNKAYPFDMHLIRCATPGSYAARNAGARESSGEVLAFMDADCWPDADWLAHGVSSLMAEAAKSIIGGEVTIVRPDKPTAVALYQYATGFGQESNVRDKGFSATANLLCTREQFAAVGPFDERLLSGGDLEWCRRAADCGYGVRYEPKAVIYTRPRASLHGAIRQARRVAAGRRMLRRLGLTYMSKAAVAERRRPWQAVSWILSNKTLGVWDRLRVLCVAVVIRGASAAESARLALGANAERR